MPLPLTMQLNPTLRSNAEIAINNEEPQDLTLTFSPSLKAYPELRENAAAASRLQTSSQQKLYSSERSFTAAKYEEAIWNRLLPGDAEGYRYHLAVEISKMREFRTGIVAVKRGGVVVCLAPYFIAQQRWAQAVAQPTPSALPVPAQKAPDTRVICVGSPVTSHCKLGIKQDYPLDADMIDVLNEQLELIARREGISTIAYKDITASQAQQLGLILQGMGFVQLDGKPLLHHTIRHRTIEEYLAQLDEPKRERLQNLLQEDAPLFKMKVTTGLPDNMDALYSLYEHSHQRDADGTPKLSPEFFESVAALMPNDCRFVQYHLPDSPDGSAGRLIGFSMLLYCEGVAIEKCRVIDACYKNGMPLEGSSPSDSTLISLMWLHNLQLCTQDRLQAYRHHYLGEELEHDLVKIGWADVKTSYSYFRQVSANMLI